MTVLKAQHTTLTGSKCTCLGDPHGSNEVREKEACDPYHLKHTYSTQNKPMHDITEHSVYWTVAQVAVLMTLYFLYTFEVYSNDNTIYSTIIAE